MAKIRIIRTERHSSWFKSKCGMLEMAQIMKHLSKGDVRYLMEGY